MPDQPRDAHTIKTEWLEAQLRKNQTTDLMLDGIIKIQQGGTMGIQEIALANPELIIAVLEGLVEVIIIQRQDITETSESWLASVEEVEKLNAQYEELLDRYHIPRP